MYVVAVSVSLSFCDLQFAQSHIQTQQEIYSKVLGCKSCKMQTRSMHFATHRIFESGLSTCFLCLCFSAGTILHLSSGDEKGDATSRRAFFEVFALWRLAIIYDRAASQLFINSQQTRLVAICCIVKPIPTATAVS